MLLVVLARRPDPPSRMTHLPGDSPLERARKGDPDALQDLLERNQDRLRRVAHRRIGERLRNHVRTSDLLQSTYIDVLSSVQGFQGQTESDFTNWVVRVLENNIKDAVRFFEAEKRGARKGSSDVDVESVSVPDDGRSPSAEVSLGEELALIGRALHRLPKDYRRILTLHLKPGQDHQTSARLMNRTEGASRVLLARARAALLIEIEKLRGPSS